MKYRPTLFLFALLLCHGLSSISMAVMLADEQGSGQEEEEQGQEQQEMGQGLFLLQNSKRVVKTNAGEMTVVRGVGGKIIDRPMHIGFITMEPKSLFIPQYLDSSLIIFIRRGKATLGSIYKDELAEKSLKTGDVYTIPSGSVFYLVNTGEGQRLHVICSIDASHNLGMGIFESFYIAGGRNPRSVLAGFDPTTLMAAFNVSMAELTEILTRQQEGPILHLQDSHSPDVWAKFVKLKQQDKLNHLKKMGDFNGESEYEYIETGQPVWSWRKLLKSFFWEENKKKDEKKTRKSPDSYNLYDRKADFKNNYGWSLALDESDYSPLKDSGIGIYLVNLTAGSMMAPHVNPTATEYGVVLSGSGVIQIVYPNGTCAMNTRVNEGQVFLVPKYFPFCQIASRTGPFEFFGFTTSSQKNRPQFLAGKSSVLQTLRGPELATAFGVSEERLGQWLDAQEGSVILSSTAAAPPEKKPENYGKDLILDI